MRILAMDTSCSVAAVAVLEEDKLLAHTYLDDKLTHSQKLMPMVAQVLRELGLRPEDIDVYGASVGPGSFTGLRIGIATVKGLARGADKPVCGISTTMAMAYQFPYCQMEICPMLDARNGQVFYGRYRYENGTLQELTPPGVLPAVQLAADFSGPVLLMGDGAVKYKDTFAPDPQVWFAPPHLNMPSGAAVAYGILQKARAGESMPPAQLLPLYVRKSQAEQEREKRLAAQKGKEVEK